MTMRDRLVQIAEEAREMHRRYPFTRTRTAVACRADAYAATAGQSPTSRAEPEGVATPKSSSGGPAETAAETE